MAFWLRHTDYYTLPGVQTFRSVAALAARLLAGGLDAVAAEMAAHSAHELARGRAVYRTALGLGPDARAEL